MSRMDSALAADIAFMLDFLGLAEPGQSSVPTAPEVRQREFLRIIGRLIELRDYLEIHYCSPPTCQRVRTFCCPRWRFDKTHQAIHARSSHSFSRG